MPSIPKPKRRPWEPKPTEYNKLAGQGRKFGGNQKFYRSKTWRSCRAAGLAAEPLCVACQKVGKVTAATVRDHIKPINPQNAWDTQNGLYPHPLDRSNHQSMCAPCHNSKSAKERHNK